MSEAVFLYITTNNRLEAISIGRSLLEKRLVACVNVLDGVSSMYWWQGEIQQEKEAILIAKTQSHLTQPATDLVKSLHSYSCPCVVALPIKGGNPAFLEWIATETASQDDNR